MRIGGFDAVENEAGVGVSATLSWEDSDRPDDTLYFDSPRIRPAELIDRPEAFVLAAFPLALWFGERRVLVEGVVCPRLREGAALAVEQMIDWHPHLRPMTLEAGGGFVPSVPPTRRHAAVFLSGGIDSMSLFRRNRLEYPPEHPGSIRTAFFVFGLNTFDFERGAIVPERRAAAARYAERLGAFARSQGVEFVPVESNIRGLYPEFSDWKAVGWGLGTVAPGLAAAGGISDLWVASTGAGLDMGNRAQTSLAPWVSPAALDFRVGERVARRLEEIRLVSEWRGAGAVVSSCFLSEILEEPRINCGVCEKCVRTMLAIVALGKVSEMESFPSDTLTAALVDRVADSVDPEKARYYHGLPALLRDVGRPDLAAAVESLIQAVPPRPASSPPGFWGRVLRRPS